MVIEKLNEWIERIQAVPDRHLTGLYALLALVTVMAARANTSTAGWAILIAFFTVGTIRAIKHPAFADVLFSFVIGIAAGAGAFGVLRAFSPSLVGPQSGVLLATCGAMAFTFAAAIIAPITHEITERAAKHGKAR